MPAKRPAVDPSAALAEEARALIDAARQPQKLSFKDKDEKPAQSSATQPMSPPSRAYQAEDACREALTSLIAQAESLRRQQEPEEAQDLAESRDSEEYEDSGAGVFSQVEDADAAGGSPPRSNKSEEARKAWREEEKKQEREWEEQKPANNNWEEQEEAPDVDLGDFSVTERPFAPKGRKPRSIVPACAVSHKQKTGTTTRSDTIWDDEEEPIPEQRPFSRPSRKPRAPKENTEREKRQTYPSKLINVELPTSHPAYARIHGARDSQSVVSADSQASSVSKLSTGRDMRMREAEKKEQKRKEMCPFGPLDEEREESYHAPRSPDRRTEALMAGDPVRKSPQQIKGRRSELTESPLALAAALQQGAGIESAEAFAGVEALVKQELEARNAREARARQVAQAQRKPELAMPVLGAPRTAARRSSFLAEDSGPSVSFSQADEESESHYDFGGAYARGRDAYAESGARKRTDSPLRMAQQLAKMSQSPGTTRQTRNPPASPPRQQWANARDYDERDRRHNGRTFNFLSSYSDEGSAENDTQPISWASYA